MKEKQAKKNVMLRIAEEDYDLIKERAYVERITVSGWIRNIIVATAIAQGGKP